MNPFVIVGSGLAAYNTGREIRKHDKETPLIFITEEDGSYYSKPSLSTAMSQGKTAEDLIVHTSEAMANQLQAEVLAHTTVTRIDPATQELYYADKKLTYKACVLATGTTPLPLPVRGVQNGVYHVNSRQDYQVFRDRIQSCKKVVILGSGLIGTEFSHDLSKQGIDVTFVSKSATPLKYLLPPEAGQAVIDSLTAQGVHFIGDAVATAIEPSEKGQYEVFLSTGERIVCDAILSAIGLKPNTDLAAAAGLPVRKGIVVDRFLRTSDPNIFAIGDVAEIAGTLLQFVMPLMHQSKALGLTLTGTPTQVVYPCMPVSVKTACAVTVAVPHEPGVWTVEGASPHFKALCHNAEGKVVGWALTGDRTQERKECIGLVSGLFV